MQISKTTKNESNSSDGPGDLSELAIQLREAKEILKQSGAKRFEDLIGKDGIAAQMLRLSNKGDDRG